MRRTSAFVAALAALTLGACSSGAPSASTGASTSDARVRSYIGQVPPEIGADTRWLNVPPASLAAQRGRVVFLQFAFPT